MKGSFTMNNFDEKTVMLAAPARKSTLLKALLLGGSAMMILPTTSFAQEDDDAGYAQFEEVIVTAQRREESLIDVPTSLTSLSMADLEASGVNRLRDIGHIVPNLIATGPNTNGRPDYVIRGIASGGGQPGFESALGIYIDGVYMGRETAANPDIVDIQRVEILRGPQGTLYGKNSISGAINITTVKPDNELTAKVDLEIGNYNLRQLSGSVSLPIVEDKLFAKVSGFTLDRDGYTQNVFRDEDIDNENSYGLRFHLRATPTDNLEINLTADGAWDDRRIVFDETAAPSLTGAFVEGPRTVAFDAEQTEDRRVRGVGMTIDYELESGHIITAVGGIRDSKIDVPGDADGSPLDFAITNFRDSMEQTSLELRVASPANEKFDYVAGLFYYDATNQSNRDVFTGAVIAPIPFQVLNQAIVDTSSYAAFVNMNYHVSEKLTVNLGARYTHEKKEIDYFQRPDLALQFGFGYIPIEATDIDRPKLEEDNFAPSLALRYAVAEDWSAYAKVSRGFKSGGWSTELLSTSDVSFDSEFLTNYEVGLKGVGLDKRLRVSLAAFYMKYKDLQVVQIDPITTFGVFTNAGAASSKGFEIELQALPTDGLVLSGSFGYTNAKFDEFENCSGPLPEDNCNGNRLARAPKYTANLAIEYSVPVGDGEIMARGDWSYRGDLFFNPQNTLEVLNPGYSIFNARIGYASEDWDVFFWGKNLTDKDTFNGISNPNLVGNSIVVYGNPRTYGVKVSARF